MTSKGTPSRWELLPGWRRAAVRWIAILSALGTSVGALYDWAATLVCIEGLTAILGAYGSFSTWRAWLKRKHYQKYILPLHQSLHSLVGRPENINPNTYIKLRRDWWSKDDSKLVISYSSKLSVSPAFREAFLDIIGQKLGTDQIEATWQSVGATPSVTIIQLPKPPEKVTFSHAEYDMRMATESTPILGYGRKKRIVSVNLDSDSPHIAVSGVPGTGKSVFVKSLMAQMLNKGNDIVLLDRKGSHRWAKKNSKVKYCYLLDDIHNELVGLGKLAFSRNMEAFESDDDFYDIGTRIGIVFEDMNATLADLQSYWQSIRENDEPMVSPAVSGYRNVLFVGRAAKMHVIAVAQLLSARAAGGTEARTNFDTRLLARAPANVWKMLAPEIKPIPARSRIKGRFYVVHADTATECQGIFLSDDEARSFALGISEDFQIAQDQQGVSMLAAQGIFPGQKQPYPPDLSVSVLSLREAVSNKILSFSLATVRRLSHNPGFPEPVGEQLVRGGKARVYRVDDLIQWNKRQTAIRGI